ncbi:MAG: hypothetical protein HP491_01885 [Nitrospira sp.]|nr:hypothetical protein [Nitrospira sp.]MBH0182283.1 hypothetical protein [Nitrospira sp.]MBH0184669.1 hypothetical protein [Nitrospira sp.]
MNRSGYYGRLPLVTCIVAVGFFSLITTFTTPAWSQSSGSDQQQGTATGAGMQAAAAVSTILYFPFKGAFAIGGGLVGGLAYLFSGGSEQTAKSIWIPSMYGTYVIVPEHLTGDRPVRFLGVAAESERATAVPVQ